MSGFAKSFSDSRAWPWASHEDPRYSTPVRYDENGR
jgi:hypothetical protein